MIGVSQLLT